MAPKGRAYNCYRITDPLLKVLAPGAGKYLNFEMFDYDGECSRNLKEDLIGRIGIEANFIFLEIIGVIQSNTIFPMRGRLV